ncbi:hypothetical protein RIF29_23174 [Crotalaria pallida]|uniref:Uncharacterized protein n=1 Tax=Crotalaria pallida TaxID=3830 RepID=A0AAN9I8H0_CROPI
MISVTWERHQGCWIQFDKRTCGFLNSVCGTFADLDQDQGLLCLCITRAQKDAVLAEAQVRAQKEPVLAEAQVKVRSDYC